jgi:glycosyltransferase involved in cell wall biosynthesis
VRIAIDYTAAINQRAGIGRFVRGLVGGLAAIDRENSYQLVHARPDPGARPLYPAAPNFSVRQLRFTERVLTIVWQRLGLPLHIDLFTAPFDVFHAPDFVLPPVRQGRTVLTVHDLAFLLVPECADARLRAYLEVAVPRSVQRADLIVTDSENTRNDVIVLLNAKPDRVITVPGGVESWFRPVDDAVKLADVRARLGLDRPFILYVGLIEPRKNLVRLMDAFALLKARRRLPHRLVLGGGRGWLSDGIFAHAEKSPVANEIQFLGYVADADLPALYSLADCFAFPSRYEGFGLPVLEAMACGVPVVTADSSSLPEIAGDGAGLLVNADDVGALADALEQLILDEALRARLRQKGLERAAQFTWEAAAARQLDVYRRLC